MVLDRNIDGCCAAGVFNNFMQRTTGGVDGLAVNYDLDALRRRIRGTGKRMGAATVRTYGSRYFIIINFIATK